MKTVIYIIFLRIYISADQKLLNLLTWQTLVFIAVHYIHTYVYITIYYIQLYKFRFGANSLPPGAGGHELVARISSPELFRETLVMLHNDYQA